MTRPLGRIQSSENLPVRPMKFTPCSLGFAESNSRSVMSKYIHTIANYQQCSTFTITEIFLPLPYPSSSSLPFQAHPKGCPLLVIDLSCAFLLYQTSPLSGIPEGGLAILRLRPLEITKRPLHNHLEQWQFLGGDSSCIALSYQTSPRSRIVGSRLAMCGTSSAVVGRSLRVYSFDT